MTYTVCITEKRHKLQIMETFTEWQKDIVGHGQPMLKGFNSRTGNNFFGQTVPNGHNSNKEDIAMNVSMDLLVTSLQEWPHIGKAANWKW